jgi:hypothetical protein
MSTITRMPGLDRRLSGHLWASYFMANLDEAGKLGTVKQLQREGRRTEAEAEMRRLVDAYPELDQAAQDFAATVLSLNLV